MGHNNDFDRRTVLCGAAGVLAAGVLAGCSGGNGSGSGSGQAGSGGDGSGGGVGTGAANDGAAATDTGSPTDAGTAVSTETGSEPTAGSETSAQVESWLAGANNYDGSIADMTGMDTVEIAVGAGDDGFAFGPAAVRVSPGTTIRWTWTGRGGAHNVVSQDGAFDSGSPQVGESVTYEATLDQSGTHLYYCEPHRRLGMKGAVVGNV